MELGTRLRQARLEAGLSQKALCGDKITRNMLSQIENGTAKPSMDTLCYLAGRLGRNVGYFLEDTASPMVQARAAFTDGELEKALAQLADLQDPEAALLKALCYLALAEQAMGAGRMPYARQLLEQASGTGQGSLYWDLLLRRYQILLAQATGQTLSAPPDDRELLLRAKDALERELPHRAGQYLDAAEDHDTAGWNLLRGQAYLGEQDYENAKVCFQIAEPEWPKVCAGFLEQCCEKLEDFKGAYYYARRLRELEG